MSEQVFINALQQFLPENTTIPVSNLLAQYNVHLKISRPRATKLGDYRAPHGNRGHRISINNDLNPFAFLITLVHEIAHLTTWLKKGNKVKPHGQLWQNEFKTLLTPFINQRVFPNDILMALLKHLHNPAASSCRDANLMKVLKKYDPQKGTIFLEDLQLNEHFMLYNGGHKRSKQVFKKGLKQRTRYKCEEVFSGKYYLINKLAEVILIDNNHC